MLFQKKSYDFQTSESFETFTVFEVFYSEVFFTLLENYRAISQVPFSIANPDFGNLLFFYRPRPAFSRNKMRISLSHVFINKSEMKISIEGSGCTNFS